MLNVMLVNQEITVESRSGAARAVAVFDLSRAQTQAVAEALAFYHRRRFATVELDADSALAMYAVAAVSDQLAPLAEADGHSTPRLDEAGVGILAEAVSLYLVERDVDDYMPPDERARLDFLRPLGEPLLELAAELREAESRLATSGCRDPAPAAARPNPASGGQELPCSSVDLVDCVEHVARYARAIRGREICQERS